MGKSSIKTETIMIKSNGTKVHVDSSDPALDAKIHEWLSWDQNLKTRRDIEQMVNDNNYDELRKLLMHRITFGTAGLRERMGAGYTRMNDLVVIQTGQGILSYLKQTTGGLLRNNGIVIGYDGRYNSKRFAELTAAIFLSENIPIHLFSTVVPTPFVPFTITRLNCAAGVMITASHNPKEDNGYKVFASNGAQIISPVDVQMQNHILDNLEPLDTSWNTTVVHSSQLVTDPLPQTLVNYYLKLGKELVNEHKAINAASDVKFTYTAMHGVGYNYVERAFKLAGLQMISVVEQQDPDPEFPTVTYPNPEEGKNSLNLSFKTANAHDSRVILANDPDADRLACAEKQPNGEWKIFTGNEMGALLGWWMFNCYQKKQPNSNLSDVYMLASTVSSQVLKSMAKIEGFNFIDTLTGFKWMGNKAIELEKEGKHVIFAFEEAIGFICGPAVKDKDGVSAAVHMATLCTFLYKHGLTLAQQLDEIYKEYGIHITQNSYFTCYEAPVIAAIFQRLRNFHGPNTYPKSVLNGKYPVEFIRDLTTGYDNAQPNNKAVLPVSKSSQMITFTFENGVIITVRTSGTEPKIKYYTELCAKPGQVNRSELEATLAEVVQGFIDEFLEPSKNNIIAKAD